MNPFDNFQDAARDADAFPSASDASTSASDASTSASDASTSASAASTSDRSDAATARNASPIASKAARRGGKWLNVARRAAGVVFMAAGAFKLRAPAQPGFAGGARGFGQALATIHVPFSHFFGYAIPILEVAGGAVLCGSWILARRGETTARHDETTARHDETSVWRIGQIERLACALLACDMIAAIALVGVPGALGHPLRMGKLEIGNERWRVPLEIALLLIVLQRAKSRAGTAD